MADCVLRANFQTIRTTTRNQSVTTTLTSSPNKTHLWILFVLITFIINPFESSKRFSCHASTLSSPSHQSAPSVQFSLSPTVPTLTAQIHPLNNTSTPSSSTPNSGWFHSTDSVTTRISKTKPKTNPDQIHPQAIQTNKPVINAVNVVKRTAYRNPYNVNCTSLKMQIEITGANLFRNNNITVQVKAETNAALHSPSNHELCNNQNRELTRRVPYTSHLITSAENGSLAIFDVNVQICRKFLESSKNQVALCVRVDANQRTSELWFHINHIEDNNNEIDINNQISLNRERRDNAWTARSDSASYSSTDSILNDVTSPNQGEPPIQSFPSRISSSHVTHIDGFRVDRSEKSLAIGDDGIPSILINTDATLRLFGSGITENTVIIFTQKKGRYGGSCLMPVTSQFRVTPGSVDVHNALFDINIAINSDESEGEFYICTKETAPKNATPAEIEETENAPFVHQGADKWLSLRTHAKILPIWASIIVVVVCLSFSALFSGLNLGLMSLDRTELKILCNTGTEKERLYANKIQPVRDHGNYLLCSILLGNVFVNSIFTILLDDLTSGVIAVVFSTLLIVLFGEITPQALCSRHGLAVGAKTIFITKMVMILTSPLSYPISKILDLVLGEEIGNVYNRERLKELVKVTTGTNDLDKDEVNIISGALELRKKTVSDVMTRIEDVFMLDYDSILDFETVSEIMKSGFSRIPVFEGNRNNIITMLYIKDLAFVDPDDNTPLKTLCQFYQNPCNFVFEDVTLDIMFRQFKEGHKGHMAFVHRVNNEGEGDPFYETIGLVTLEDVIEELIQAEIMDETDVFTDNRSKRRRNEHRKQDFTVFAERRDNQRLRISPQLTLATFQYLSTSIDIFKPDTISETILRRMLKQDIIVHIKKSKEKHDPASIIYQQGKPVDYFVLILEGRVEVTVGRENLVFESGPFTYFGTQALIQNIGGVVESPVQPATMGSLQSVNMEALLRHTFVPDYSVRATTEILYIRIKRSLYMAAKRATLMERSQKDTTTSTPGDQFDDEVEKLLHSLEDENNSVGRSSPIHSEVNDLSPKENTTTTPAKRNSSPGYSNPLGRERSPPVSQSFSKTTTPSNGAIKYSNDVVSPASNSIAPLVYPEDNDLNEEDSALLPKINPS